MQQEKRNTDDRWELITRVVSGEANSDDLSLFNKWSHSNTEFKALYENIKSDWDMIANLNPISEGEVDRAWYIQHEKIKEFERSKDPLHTIKMAPLLRMAASITILIALSLGGLKLYNYMKAHQTPALITASYEKSGEVALPDGSSVTLNNGGNITYPKKFIDSVRKVKLSGEAFFEVQDMKNKPFIVEVANAEIRVLGTSFNVICDDIRSEVEVFVESGKVKVLPRNEKCNELILEPGYVGFVTEHEARMAVNTNENYLAWKTRKVVFKETPLKDVVKTLNRMYDIKIILDDNITGCKFTSTFFNQDIDTLLEVLCTTFHLKMEKTEKNIILMGTGC